MFIKKYYLGYYLFQKVLIRPLNLQKSINWHTNGIESINWATSSQAKVLFGLLFNSKSIILATSFFKKYYLGYLVKGFAEA